MHVITFVTSRYVRLLWPPGGTAACRGGSRHIVKPAAGRTRGKRAAQRREHRGEERKASSENPAPILVEVRNELEHPARASLGRALSAVFCIAAFFRNFYDSAGDRSQLGSLGL